MSQIVKYQKNNKGTYTVIVTDVEIPEQAIDLLNLEQPIDVDCTVIDPNAITGKQRRKIFALVNDIEAHTGQPRDYMRQMFQDYVRFIYGYEERISLSDCNRKVASQIIEVIIEWVFLNDIPLQYKTSNLLKENKAFLYWATITRHCVICGKSHSDLAHLETVGRGMNRNKINHYDKHVLALCREHHTEQHKIGINTFNDRYHLSDSWIKVDDRLNKMLKGEEINAINND
ncbi:putative HNHc nuclease [Staphylococcus sp. Marseille-Q1834]|uniref:putative HNHc nuclease n=1 Tax=Staphylococcus sp. Marseille-Q1834 TaxID=2866594 RepID=UPI001CF8DC99|nr:putative HNHc nuclease [Staphylococcus sp. Marseille-Q1834]